MANVSSSNGLEKRPKLRFPGFDEPWEENELSHYLVENTERNRGLAFGKEDVLSVSGEYGVINQIAFQGRSFAGESVADYHVVETDDIVYTKSPLKANPYGIIKVNKGIPGIVSTLYAVYHPLNTIAPRFVDLYFANDLRLNKFLKPLVNIGAKHDMKVNNSFVLTGIVVFPSIGEQQKLVGFFAKLDRRIEAQRKIVETLKKYKRGVTRRLFAQEKGSFETNLQIVSLGDLFPFIRNGFVGTATPFFTDREHGVRYLQGTNIHAGKITDDTVYYVTKDFNAKHSKNILKRDDILVVQSGHVGECAVVGKEYEGANCHALIIMSNGGNCFSDYVAQYINSEAGNKQIASITTGNTIRHILASAIADMVIPIPSLEEQKRVAYLLSIYDDRIAKEEQLLSELEAMRKGLLQQLFI